jgi:hypothetical protein
MMRIALIVVLSALRASTMPAAAADYELKLIPSNTHTGSFDARIKPVLRIAPGDTVKVETLVAFGMDRLLAAGASEVEIPDSVKAMDKYMKEKDLYGGTLTGPIYVEGAQTGDTLEVQILPGFEFLHQGNRVKKSTPNETCQVVVVPRSDKSAGLHGILFAGRF